jgi:hypothetical protein
VIVQKEMKARTVTGRPVVLLPGALVCYREWYGEDEQREGQNIGLKLPIEDWARGVLKRSGDEDIAYDVADRSIFSEDGGPSLAERASKVVVKEEEAAPAPGGQAAPAWLEPGARAPAR